MLSIKFGPAAARAMLLGSLLVCAGFVGSAAAQDPHDITLRLGSTTGNPGDTIEVVVDLEADGVLPESLVVFLAYDVALLTPVEDAYELILRDPLSGEPILDGEGNTVAVTSALRPSDNLRAAGKSVDSETYGEEGVLGVSIQGLNMEEILPGELFSVAFRVADDAVDGALAEIAGVSEGAEVLIPDGNGGVVAVATSAARTEGTDVVNVTYAFEDVLVPIGCVPPTAPGGVSATRNRSDAVVVSWGAVAGASIEYRVFRSSTNNAASASAIGEAWQTATTFSDITARVPEMVPGDGCNVPDELQEVHYFYWVRARSQEGCESDLSTPPAEGFRTESGTASASTGAAYAAMATALLLAGRARRRRTPAAG